MDKSKLFSKEALEKLRSPERLDSMIRVTTPAEWLLMCAVVIMLLSIIIWSVLGSFTIKSEGMGLITDYGGIFDVVHESSGVVQNVYVKKGDHVEKGDIVATIFSSNEVAEMALASNNIEIASGRMEVESKTYDRDTKVMRVANANFIRANVSGVIDAVNMENGMYLKAGNSACTIRNSDGHEDLKGVLYVPVENAKRIEPGMSVQIEPNNSDSSESGKILGVVKEVSQYPVTVQTAVKSLGNQQLFSWISDTKKSSLVEVEFTLLENENDPSGYLWTSALGKHKKVTAGTFCKGAIIIESQPPIEKVFYKISQWLISR